MDLEKLKALCEDATPGPFKVARYDHGGARVYTEDMNQNRELVADFFNEADRECWIAARTAVPELIARIEELEQKIQSWLAEEVLRDEREKRLVVASEKAAFLEGWCREVCAARGIGLPAILKD